MRFENGRVLGVGAIKLPSLPPDARASPVIRQRAWSRAPSKRRGPSAEVATGRFFGGRLSLPGKGTISPPKPLMGIEVGGTMANRQQRGNREQKKPKKDKSKSAPASPGSIWETVDKAHTNVGSGGKK